VIRDFYLKQAEEHKKLLLAMGFQEMAVIDFYEAYHDTLKALIDENWSSNRLLKAFQDAYNSNAIVVYLRFLTSAHLKKYEDLYLPFLDDAIQAMGIEYFCNGQVEAMDREADEIHLIALTKTLGRITRVAYLDAADTELILHPFIPDNEEEAKKRPEIHLLYHPGHYDLLYA
jgi:ubiquitin thioesterase protein OTUB1